MLSLLLSYFYSESIHRTADALVQDTRSLVMGAGEDQERLAGSTQMAVRNISQLADVVKQGAALIGPGQSDSQVSVVSHWLTHYHPPPFYLLFLLLLLLLRVCVVL